MNREELIWAQKARTNWILHGDSNTKYFQTMVRQRRSKNRIIQIRNENEHLTDNPEEIEHIFLDSFKRSYSSNTNLTVESIIQEIQGLPIPTLTDQQVHSLNRAISNREIEEAVFQMGLTKLQGLMAVLYVSLKNFGILSRQMCAMLFKPSFTLVLSLRFLIKLS